MSTEEDLKFINPHKLFTGAFIPNWLLNRPEVSQGAKLCYARLCQYAGKKGDCFPKQKALAEEIGVRSRQVRNYLDELEALKLIFPVKFDFQSQNMYRFLLHPWMGGVGLGDIDPKRQYSATLERQDIAGLDRQKSAAYIIEENQKARESKSKNIKKQEASPAVAAALDNVSKDGFNIYELINRVKKDLGWENGRMFPEEVILNVCKRYFQDKGVIADRWSWFKRVLLAESELHFHYKFKNEKGVLSLKEILEGAKNQS